MTGRRQCGGRRGPAGDAGAGPRAGAGVLGGADPADLGAGPPAAMGTSRRRRWWSPTTLYDAGPARCSPAPGGGRAGRLRAGRRPRADHVGDRRRCSPTRRRRSVTWPQLHAGLPTAGYAVLEVADWRGVDRGGPPPARGGAPTALTGRVRVALVRRSRARTGADADECGDGGQRGDGECDGAGEAAPRSAAGRDAPNAPWVIRTTAAARRAMPAAVASSAWVANSLVMVRGRHRGRRACRARCGARGPRWRRRGRCRCRRAGP